MGNSQTEATKRYRDKMGIKSKKFNLHEKLINDYTEACEKAGVSQTTKITELMQGFIDEVNNK